MRYAMRVLFSLFAIAVGASAYCANHEPSLEHLAAEERSMAMLNATNTADYAVEANGRFNYNDSQILIDVDIHVIMQGKRGNKDRMNGFVSPHRIEKSIEVLNDGFKDTGISFKLRSTDFFYNRNWAKGYKSMAMKTITRSGSYSTLNIWIIRAMPKDNILGDTYYPVDPSISRYRSDWWFADGIMILGEALPGGNKENYQYGISLIHEAGHWFGLYHPFRLGCKEPNDFVADTPLSKHASYSCDEKRNTCKKKLRDDPTQDDPVHNYMNYSPDLCRNEFTQGQIDRMRGQYGLYRKGRDLSKENE